MCVSVCLFYLGLRIFLYIRIRHVIIVFGGMIWHSMMAAIFFGAILELPPYWNCRHIGIWYYISHFCINAYDHGFSLTSLHHPFISDYRKYACSNNDLFRFYCHSRYHGWPSTQPGSLHTALQRKYTQPCSLFSRGTAVWTMGARLCEQWGTAVCKCPAV